MADALAQNNAISHNVRYGFTYDTPVYSFIVPKTSDVIEKFLKPSLMSFPSFIVLLTCLGYILRNQSKNSWFIKKFSAIANSKSIFGHIFKSIALGGIDMNEMKTVLESAKIVENFEVKQTVNTQTIPSIILDQFPNLSCPPALLAWLAFRHMVDLVLFNDVFSQISLMVKNLEYPLIFPFHLPLTSSEWLWTLFRVFGGIVLIAFNYWAKVDAHRIIGDYSWFSKSHVLINLRYWGDFFFRVPQELIFNGVFEYFPHPMYSVGYSAFYGMALIAGSYIQFFLVIFVHVCQMIFLIVVENPHIDKIYGEDVSPFKKSIETLSSNGYIQLEYKDAISIYNLDFFRASDLLLIILSCHICFLVIILEPIQSVVYLIVYTTLYCLAIGIALYMQGKTHFWTNHYKNTRSNAFNQWKCIYNVLMTARLTIFICCSIKLWSFPEFFTPGYALSICCGLLFIGISIWTQWCVYEAIGDFGWFYGDFFVDDEKLTPNLCYSGIYRFMNNPDAIIGFFGFYGLAIIAQSWALFWVAFYSHFLAFLFLNLVEKPFMERRYKDNMRDNAPLVNKLKDELKESIDSFKSEAKQLSEHSKELETKLLEGYSEVNISEIVKSSLSVLKTETKRFSEHYERQTRRLFELFEKPKIS